MGFFDKIFSKQENFPEMDETSPVSKRMDHFRHDLEEFARDIDDSMEVIPTEDTAYVFIGKPPKKFGIAWIRDGKVNSFKTLAQEQGVPELKLQMMTEKIRSAYENCESASRFSANIANHKVTVTSSDSLDQELHKIIQ